MSDPGIQTRLQTSGHAVILTDLPSFLIDNLRSTAFAEGKAGKRCLLNRPPVAETATRLRETLHQAGVLPPSAVAIQAIAFDKSPVANWKVAWHQDLMFPIANAPKSPGYRCASIKDKNHFAQPPDSTLNELLAVRLHLDDCDATNGPLRVSPGTHRFGSIPTDEIPRIVAQHGESVCLALTGEALLMLPLLLHASSQATQPKHRRVLHFVFHCGAPPVEPWAQTV